MTPRTIRTRLHLSTAQLARWAGVTRGAVDRYEAIRSTPLGTARHANGDADRAKILAPIYAQLAELEKTISDAKWGLTESTPVSVSGGTVKRGAQ